MILNKKAAGAAETLYKDGNAFAARTGKKVYIGHYVIVTASVEDAETLIDALDELVER
jgi:hypothetical protein